MIIVEFIGELIARIFVEIVFEGIIMGLFKLIGRSYRYLTGTIFGKK